MFKNVGQVSVDNSIAKAPRRIDFAGLDQGQEP
jgi:hypothetical protein